LPFEIAYNGVKIAFNGFFPFGGILIRVKAQTSDRCRKTRRQRATPTAAKVQHGARLEFSHILGVFSARRYSRQGSTAKTQYKRFLTASRLDGSGRLDG
jgi:hypothetical protein